MFKQVNKHYNLPDSSNLSFYRQIARYKRGVGDHMVGQWQTNKTVNWGAFNHATHAPQLKSCNYNLQIKNPVAFASSPWQKSDPT